MAAFLLGVLLDCFEVADAFCYANEGVGHVFLVLQTEGAFVAYLAEHLDKQGEVDDATAQLYGMTCLCGLCDVLQMHVEHSLCIALQVLDGVCSIAQIVPDIQTHSYARVAVLDVFPDGGCIGIEGHVWSVQMDGIADACLLDFLLHMVEHILVGRGIAPGAWNAYYEVHSYPLCIGKSLIHCSHIFHIYRAYAIANDAVCSQFLLELGYLFCIGIEGQMEVLDAEVVDINLLHEGQCGVDVKLVEGVASHADVEGVGSLCIGSPDGGVAALGRGLG